MSLSENSFADNCALTKLFGDGPRVKILSALLVGGKPKSKKTIAEMAGVSRTTVHRHLPKMVELGVVKPIYVGGYEKYEIDKSSEVAGSLAKLEWDVIDKIAAWYEAE